MNRLILMIVPVLIVARACDEPSARVSTKFAHEQVVTIIGYDDHAMEPFISRDGQHLFWNSLNDAVNTSIYYARRLDDTHFQFLGQVNGVNGPVPHLDAVASLDISGNFYWVSTRNYPNVVENYQRGRFRNGSITDVAPVQGDFYVRQPGWIIMDAEISPDGKVLFFVNARFAGKAIPEDADIGVAHNVNNQFIKDRNSEILFRDVNTEAYLEYAPSLSPDGRELFFTRAVGGDTDIYVASRNSLNEPFGVPELIDIKGRIPEGPTISIDGKKLYYHKKDGPRYRIYMISRVP